MEANLERFDFEAAKAVYTLGGNSKAFAEISINVIGGHHKITKRGLTVKQGNVAVGILRSAIPDPVGIIVSYGSKCEEGGLATKDVSGCFTVSGGPLTIDDEPIGPPVAVKNTYTTLASFSTTAQSQMQGQEFYAKYRAYFNEGDYAHQRVMAA